jgi:hypothetical protein
MEKVKRMHSNELIASIAIHSAGSWIDLDYEAIQSVNKQSIGCSLKNAEVLRLLATQGISPTLPEGFQHLAETAQ